MCQANWMSLGIMVTLFACMAQRLASSRSPTKYASAASCRHNMACAWKCRSYLPTSRVILQTSHEKCSFWIRSSMVFWNWWISWRATIPSWYFWGFFSSAACKNSFWGGLASHGRLELLANWLLPTWCRWPSFCSHLSQLLGWQWPWWPPTPPASLPLLSSSSPPDLVGPLVLELGGPLVWKASEVGHVPLPWSSSASKYPSHPFPGCYFSSCHAGI